MKKIMLAGLLMVSSIAFAQPVQRATESTGGGNGGQTIYRGSNAYLRDLVEKNNCLWKKDDQIYRDVPKLKTILDKIYQLNSSFYWRVSEEIKQLGFCFTTKRLPYLQYNNSDDIHIFANQEYDQVAINDSGIVFVDMTIYTQMDETNRAYLFLHEAAHELYQKQEARSAREPRLREFLMNLFEQIDTLFLNRDYVSFDYIITKANFTALEAITTYSKRDFEIIYLNDLNVSLADRMISLKKVGAIKPIYSEVLIENLKTIELERSEKIKQILSRVSLSTERSNFKPLLEGFINLNKYINGDSQKAEGVVSSLWSMIEGQDLSSDSASLETAFNLLGAQAETKFPAGHVANNYDAAFGKGLYLNQIAEIKNYLPLVLFGKKHIVTFEMGGYYKPYYYLRGKMVLGSFEKGLVYDQQATGILMSYVKNSLKYNKWLADRFIELLNADIELLEKHSESKYVISGPAVIGKIRKRDFKFSRAERRYEIELRKKLVSSIKAL